MSNAKKIMIALAGVCIISLFATLNLNRENPESRPVDHSQAVSKTQTDKGSDAETQTSGNVPTSQSSRGLPITSSSQEGVSGGGLGVADVRNDVKQQTHESPASQAGDQKSKESLAGGASDQNVTASTAGKQETKKKIKFPGIDQSQGPVMVREVRHKMGEGEDQVTVTLTVTDSSGEASGRVWIIGEYVQRGTTGVMFMPSHREMNLSADGNPQNPAVGQAFSMRSNKVERFLIKRPGFEGEELTAIRVGIWDKTQGKIHFARVRVKDNSRKTNQQRAKVDVQ